LKLKDEAKHAINEPQLHAGLRALSEVREKMLESPEKQVNPRENTRLDLFMLSMKN
jgi:hypothetical protein